MNVFLVLDRYCQGAVQKACMNSHFSQGWRLVLKFLAALPGLKCYSTCIFFSAFTFANVYIIYIRIYICKFKCCKNGTSLPRQPGREGCVGGFGGSAHMRTRSHEPARRGSIKCITGTIREAGVERRPFLIRKGWMKVNSDQPALSKPGALVRSHG